MILLFAHFQSQKYLQYFIFTTRWCCTKPGGCMILMCTFLKLNCHKISLNQQTYNYSKYISSENKIPTRTIQQICGYRIFQASTVKIKAQQVQEHFKMQLSVSQMHNNSFPIESYAEILQHQKTVSQMHNNSIPILSQVHLSI